MDILRIMTAGSVDDGKSTLIGKYFYDSEYIPQDQLEGLSRKGLNLAHYTDGLKEERELGITIDVAYRYFETKERKFIVADCPGHREFTRNMVTGLTNSDVVFVLVDASRGITEQTRRHAALSSWIGSAEVVCLINKMDLVNYEEKVFLDLQNEFQKTVRATCIPVSALKGDNLKKPSSNMPWYKGPTWEQILLEAKGRSPKTETLFTVQYAEGKDVLGQLVEGKITVGKDLRLNGGKEITCVKKILLGFTELQEMGSPGPLRLTMDKTLSRGDILTFGEALEALKFTIEWCQLLPFEDNLELRHLNSLRKILKLEITHKLNFDDNTWMECSARVPEVNEVYRGVMTIDRPLSIASDHRAAMESTRTLAAVLFK